MSITLNSEQEMIVANLIATGSVQTIALNSIREQKLPHQPENKAEIYPLEQQLRTAASLAVEDYTNDRELTIFTCLDGEEFLD